VPLSKSFARLFALTLIALGAFFLASAPRAFAQGPDIDNEVLRIAKGLYCPVCPATPLDVCETQACKQWRDLIKQKLLAGENEEQIRAYFIAQYGERVLGAPPPVGFNLGAYILPLLLLLAGGGLLFFTLRGWRRGRAQTAQEIAAVPPISREVAARIARELSEQE
jgi:cytochrome c-type biogenesis protein CcmH